MFGLELLVFLNESKVGPEKMRCLCKYYKSTLLQIDSVLCCFESGF